MGGKKKLGLKQMERMQARKDEEDQEKKRKEKAVGSPKERKTIVNVIAPDVKNEKIIGEIKKMNALTPYAVASRFNIRISAAKDFLKQLEEKGIIQLVSGSHNIKVYKPAAS
jgi:small subunit ribosomal protein S25e